MHLAPKSQLYGLPACSIRDFLRHVALDAFGAERLRSYLTLSPGKTETLLSAMLADGLIAHAEMSGNDEMYRWTAKGGRLACASVAPPIERAVADEILGRVLARAADTHAQRSFDPGVSRIALFGSMLRTAPLVSGVDIAIQLTSRSKPEPRYGELSRLLHAVGGQQNNRFETPFDSIIWPRLDVVDYLRGTERYVSIHCFTDLDILNVPYRVVLGSTGYDPGS